MAYITVTEAETLLSEFRPDLVAKAAGLKITHLEFASLILDQQNWIGTRTVPTQTNAFPRLYIPLDQYNPDLGYRDSLTIPVEIQRVCVELAVRFLTDPAITEDSSSAIGLAGISLPAAGYDLLGDHIEYLIQPFLLYPDGVLFRLN